MPSVLILQNPARRQLHYRLTPPSARLCSGNFWSGDNDDSLRSNSGTLCSRTNDSRLLLYHRPITDDAAQWRAPAPWPRGGHRGSPLVRLEFVQHPKCNHRGMRTKNKKWAAPAALGRRSNQLPPAAQPSRRTALFFTKFVTCFPPIPSAHALFGFSAKTALHVCSEHACWYHNRSPIPGS